MRARSSLATPPSSATSDAEKLVVCRGPQRRHFDGNALDKTDEVLAIELAKQASFAQAVPRTTATPMRGASMSLRDRSGPGPTSNASKSRNARTRDYVIRRNSTLPGRRLQQDALTDRAERLRI
jgi:outer membrane protein insertion porin family